MRLLCQKTIIRKIMNDKNLRLTCWLSSKSTTETTTATFNWTFQYINLTFSSWTPVPKYLLKMSKRDSKIFAVFKLVLTHCILKLLTLKSSLSILFDEEKSNSYETKKYRIQIAEWASYSTLMYILLKFQRSWSII